MPAVNELVEKDSNVEVVWRAFELRPEPIPLPDATSEFFTTMWENSIYPLAEQLDISIKMPLVKPRSRIAHEAAKWAESQGCFLEFRDALFRAYFEMGKDLGETAPILQIVRGLNLDEKPLQNSLDKEEFLGLVLADETAASNMGLSGVPAFIADNKNGLMGIQTAETLTHLLRQLD